MSMLKQFHYPRRHNQVPIKKIWLLSFTLVLVASFWVLSNRESSAQPPLPVIKGATVLAVIRFDASTGVFFYTYQVTNAPNSVGSIDDFEFDISRPTGAEILQVPDIPDITDLKLPPGIGNDYQRGSLGNSIVPVVYVSSSSEWIGLLSAFKKASWFALHSSPFIAPGSSLGNLGIASKGLVGVRTFTVKPPLRIEKYVPSINDIHLPDSDPNANLELNARLQQIGQVQMAVRFSGNTLGPTALPLNCDPACMIGFLIGEKEQAFQLGWIDNRGVANSLDAKLKEVKIKLQAGQTKVAGNILKSFILDLIAQHVGQTGQGQGQGNPQGKHVNDNAFYLLKPNAEFILYKLGQL